MKTRNLLRKIRKALAVRWRRNFWLLAAGAAVLQLGWGISDAGAVTINLSPQKRASDGAYNFRVGNIKLNFASSVTVQYSDNINRSNNDEGPSGESTARVSGWFVEPGISMALYWPVSTYMDISSGAGISYRYYPDGSGENNWEMTGDQMGTFNTNISLELKLGQTGTLTFSDSLTRNIDTIAIDTWINNDPENVDKFASARNVAAVQYAVDLNESLNARVHYDHTNTWTSPKKYQFMDYQSDTGDVVLLYDVSKQWQAGPYATATYTYYSHGDPANGNIKRDDNVDYSTGLALTYRRSAGFTADARVGWQLHHMLSDNFGTGVGTDNSTWTYSLNVNFATSEVLMHTLSSSYAITQDYLYSTVAYSKTWQTAYAASWRFARDWTLNGDLAWVRDAESASGGETGNLYRFGLGTSYEIGRNTNASFRYEYSYRVSDQENREYWRNTATVTVTHKF